MNRAGSAKVGRRRKRFHLALDLCCQQNKNIRNYRRNFEKLNEIRDISGNFFIHLQYNVREKNLRYLTVVETSHKRAKMALCFSKLLTLSRHFNFCQISVVLLKLFHQDYINIQFGKSYSDSKLAQHEVLALQNRSKWVNFILSLGRQKCGKDRN